MPDRKLHLKTEGVFYAYVSHLLQIFAVLLVLPLLASQIKAAEYEISGIATHSWLTSMGTKVDRAEQKLFTVFVEGKKWMIALYPADQTNAMWQTIGTENGIDIIHTRHGANDSATVIVETNSCPTGFHIPIAPHLWVMYASGHFFERWNGTNLPAVHRYAYEYYGVGPKGRPRYSDQRATVLFHERLPKLPKSVMLFNDGWFEPPTTNQPPRRLRRPFEYGYRDGVYESGKVHHFGEHMAASDFVFKRFSPNLNGKTSEDVYASYLCEVQVTSATNRCSLKPLQVRLPRRFVAMDHRLENASTPVVCVSYNSGDFRELPSMEHLQEFHSKRKR
jgi:hypothetical protein